MAVDGGRGPTRAPPPNFPRTWKALTSLSRPWYDRPMTQRYTTDDELRHRAAYHPPKTEDTVHAHERVRAQIEELSLDWNGEIPEGREKSMALTFLDQAMWAANAAIARGHARRAQDAETFKAIGVKGPKV
jgi:hypothetical protein